MKNKRKRGFIVTILGKESTCVCSFLAALCLYLKYRKMYHDDLLYIQEIYVLPNFSDDESSSL